ncbi:hypothetical protein [Psychromicrobium lacuslunae]|uniref:Uncharacterized protein n=1 Tax=Psychromicrobium lacuslunae TaxID=1618207 RepID=A0A0D4C1G9_9MICC|nr:hypothetical protein [Psychromicrobium lacuslunae]AJT42196.1 hypothetical protein UM93_13040 [Psychromicrobium lacuslunae]
MDRLEQLVRSVNPVAKEESPPPLAFFDTLNEPAVERISAPRTSVLPNTGPSRARRSWFAIAAAATVLVIGVALGVIFSQATLPPLPPPATQPSSPTAPATDSQAQQYTTYTTRSGLFSFKLPKGFTVKETPSLAGSQASGGNAVEVAIYAANGIQLGYLTERVSGDGASGPAPQQQVLDQQKTPNMMYNAGSTVGYYLSYNVYSGFTEVTMRLEDRSKGNYGIAPSQFDVSGNLKSSFAVNVTNILGEGAGLVELKAWQQTAQYMALKTMLTSLTRH